MNPETGPSHTPLDPVAVLDLEIGGNPQSTVMTLQAWNRVKRELLRYREADAAQLRQVGWYGQSERLYDLEEPPTEPGSFQPMFVKVDR